MYERNSNNLFTGRTFGARHPETMYNAKVRARQPQVFHLRDKQVHFFDNGRQAILRIHSALPFAQSAVQTLAIASCSNYKGKEATDNLLTENMPPEVLRSEERRVGQEC